MKKIKFPIVSAMALLSVLATLAGCTRVRELTAPKENAMRVAIAAKIPSLDPHATSDLYSVQVGGLAYESLYQYHYLKRPLEIEPLLAESLPTMSNDGKTITIKIKKGIHFHDDPCFTATNGKGRELTAEDFSYMIHRIAAPKFVSSQYSSYEGRIVGIDDYHAGKAPTISGIKVPDPYTLQIQFVKPQPRFIYNFVSMHSAPLPKECVEKLGDEIARHAIGTGPFKIVQYDPGSKIVAVRNPNYHPMYYPKDGMPGDKEKGLLEDAGRQVPFLDKVVYEIVLEDQPRWLKFMAGETDITKVPKDNFPLALPGGKLAPELASKGVYHLREVEGDVTVFIFNMEDPIWGKKKELRQAFSLALDWEKIIPIQYAGQAVKAHSLIDPTQYGYDPSWKSKWAGRDVKKAKELLAKAGYPDGKGLPPLEMPTLTSTTQRQLNELIERNVAEVGIALKPNAMTWPELTKSLREKKFSIVGIGYGSDAPDVDGAFALLHSRNVAPGPNASSYRNLEVDKLIDAVETMPNSPARLEKIRRARDLVDEDLPNVPGVHRIGNQLAHPWVKNHVFTDDMYWGAWMKYKRVETAKHK